MNNENPIEEISALGIYFNFIIYLLLIIYIWDKGIKNLSTPKDQCKNIFIRICNLGSERKRV